MASRKESARARQKATKKTLIGHQPKPKKNTSRTQAQQKKRTVKRRRKRSGIKQLEANPDFRERTNFPLPPVEEIERRLRQVLTPGTFATRLLKKKTDQNGKPIKLRDRILTLPVLAKGSHFRDEIIEVGQYRSNPCRHRLRRVSVLWGRTWHHYLTIDNTGLFLPTNLFPEGSTKL